MSILHEICYKHHEQDLRVEVVSFGDVLFNTSCHLFGDDEWVQAHSQAFTSKAQALLYAAFLVCMYTEEF